MSFTLGKTLLVANPTAQNGKGATAGRYAGKVLSESLPDGDFELVITESASQGKSLAAKASNYDTILALGGDGLVHEIVNGLMDLPEEKRPTFGLLPSGTGNDYARTLGMSSDLNESIQQIQNAQPYLIDVGICNGEYFVETLSFGLDAAIALDTVERRKRTGKVGTRVFLESGLDVLLHQRKTYEYEAVLEGDNAIEGQMLLFAVQIGRTYGGGFAVCPDAKTNDGIFDICIARAPLGLVKATTIFLLAKNAHHTRFKALEFHKAKHLTLKFEAAEPPIQIDGEPFRGNTFSIQCLPRALRVLTN